MAAACLCPPRAFPEVLREDPSGKCSSERPTRGTVCGTMRSMCGADAVRLAINYQSLLQERGGRGGGERAAGRDREGERERERFVGQYTRMARKSVLSVGRGIGVPRS